MPHSHSCSKCGANLDVNWTFCPHCGGAGIHDQPKPEHHENAPARYAFSGAILGFVTAPVFIIYGTLICLLGPPAVLGIPLIILGILAPFLGPYLAINAVRGRCPWCDNKITSLGPIDAFYCHACSKPIVIRKRELFRGADPLAMR
jgi:predicted amidophosphoribosyltransferase